MSDSAADLKGTNEGLTGVGVPREVMVYRVKHLNNIVDQDHRHIRRRIRPMVVCKVLAPAATPLGWNGNGANDQKRATR